MNLYLFHTANIYPLVMSQRELKEAFVSNLNGTSLVEVALGSFLAPVCVVNRGLVLLLFHRALGTLPLPRPLLSHLLFDYSVLIVPLVLSCTVLSGVLPLVVVTLTFAPACIVWLVHRTSRRPSAVAAFLHSHVQFNQVPFVTVFRVFVNVKTAISILAVDFSVFPRRYAKTETYGTGVMDFGVGAFVFANALVCPEARGKTMSGSRLKHISQQLLSVWPLVALGLGRVISVKMSGYQEHVTEYGVHWNFFFTLAVVRVVASALLSVLPVNRSLVFALLISGVYQFILETTGLKEFIIHNNNRDVDFVHANKEGLFSVVGHVAVYLVGVQVGAYVMQPRSSVSQWIHTLLTLLFGSFLLYAVLCTFQTFVEPVSRRLANFPFCLWSVAQSLFFVSCLGLADMVLLFSKTASGFHLLPSSWSLYKKQSESVCDRTGPMDGLCLLQAVNRNQLLFFLLANVTTGLTNSVVDTLGCGHLFSVCVLLLYMFINCLITYVLHVYGITVKFW